MLLDLLVLLLRRPLHFLFSLPVLLPSELWTLSSESPRVLLVFLRVLAEFFLLPDLGGVLPAASSTALAHFDTLASFVSAAPAFTMADQAM